MSNPRNITLSPAGQPTPPDTLQWSQFGSEVGPSAVRTVAVTLPYGLPAARSTVAFLSGLPVAHSAVALPLCLPAARSTVALPAGLPAARSVVALPAGLLAARSAVGEVSARTSV
jgi:hypothetical protein